jgi:3-hydroxybutyryl-CoA dehydratase
MTHTLSAPFEQLGEGTTFATRGRTVTEADVVAFCAQTGDWHPQHGDAEWAVDSPFGERIAHGMLVLSYAVGLMQFEPERVLALRRVSDAVFKRPVHLGDTIRAAGEVVGLTPASDDAGLVALNVKVLNQHDQLVCRARLEVLWRREVAAAATTGPARTSAAAVGV